MIAAERDEAAIRSAAMARLTRINLDDLVASFGWQDRPRLAGLARKLLGGAARTFARQIVEFDMAVETDGLVCAARAALPNYVRNVRIFGREQIPAGPFLALSNHPGMTDALAVFSALDRPDLRIIALERPFLQALPHCSTHLSFVSEDGSSQAAVVRKVGAHLRAGGAALTFPAGRIEPDPNISGGALDSLRSWTPSAGVFVRLAPETAVLPVLVRGVVWPRAAHNWLARRRTSAADREKLAAALQLLANTVLGIRPVSVGVQIGRPIYARDLGTTAPSAVHQAVLARMSELIGNPPDCG